MKGRHHDMVIRISKTIGVLRYDLLQRIAKKRIQ
jgi:hypothetical protein